jgi:hypothetical protein
MFRSFLEIQTDFTEKHAFPSIWFGFKMTKRLSLRREIFASLPPGPKTLATVVEMSVILLNDWWRLLLPRNCPQKLSWDCANILTWPFIGKLLRSTFSWCHKFIDLTIFGREMHFWIFLKKTTVLELTRGSQTTSKCPCWAARLEIFSVLGRIKLRVKILTGWFSGLNEFSLLRRRSTNLWSRLFWLSSINWS